MKPPDLKVGDDAIHVERLSWGGKDRGICAVKIVRETKTLWIDDHRTRWRKSDGAMVPQYVSPRYVVPVPK